MNKRILIILLFIMSGLAGFVLSLYFHQRVDSEEERPQLIDDTRVIQTFHYPATFVKQLEGDKEAGRKIFKEFCSACHDKTPKIDIQAPRIGDKKWDQLKKLGVSNLLKITINGAGAMPARGGCFECSDEQLRETIEYMLKANHPF